MFETMHKVTAKEAAKMLLQLVEAKATLGFTKLSDSFYIVQLTEQYWLLLYNDEYFLYTDTTSSVPF